MNPADRFVVHGDQGPVYTSDTITGVISYLWGRDWTRHWVLVYEVPVEITSGNLDILRCELYATVLKLAYPHGTKTPVF